MKRSFFSARSARSPRSTPCAKRGILSPLAFAIAVGAVVCATFTATALVAPGVAHAQAAEDDNPAKALASQPAVRHRLLLVKGRFELSPAFEATINADYKHTFGAGLKAEYHLTDMFSFGLIGIYGASSNTGLMSRILDTLPEEDPGEGDPTPTRSELSSHLNSMPIHGALYASVTPWYGKLAAFGRAFVNFDFYFQGGLAMAQLDSSCGAAVCSDPFPGGGVDGDGAAVQADDDPNNDPPLNDGTKLGIYLGGGIHVFVNNWIAIDLTVRDYVFSDNPSGLDFDADLAVTDSDTRFLNHLFMGVGVSFFFPARAQRTN